MSYEEEFDKIIRQKAEGAEFPFDEKGWLQAGKMLDAQRAAGRRALLGKWAAPVIITAVIGTSALLFIGQNYKGADKKHLAVSVVDAKDQQSTSLSENSVPEQINNLSPEQLPLTQEKAGETNILAHASPSEQSAASTPVSKPISVSKDQNSTGPLKNIVKPGSQNAIAANVSAPVLNTVQAPAENSAKAEENSNASESAKAANNETKPSEEGVVTNQKENNSNTIQAPALNASETAQTESHPTTALQSQEAPLVMMDQAVAAITVSDRLNPVMPKLDLLPVRDLQPGVVILPRYNEDYYTPHNRSRFVGLEFGATYLMGWNSSNGKDGAGLNWFAGLNAGTGMCKKTSVNVGLQLYNITNISNPFYNASEKLYSFGYTSSFTSVTTDNLYYLALPLKFNYHLSRSGFVGLGLNTGYLVKAHSRVDTYKDADGVKSNPVMQGNDKIYDGTRSINLMGSVSYNTKLNSRTTLSLEFIYGFTDLFENSENIKNLERPMGLRVGMNYHLFKN